MRQHSTWVTRVLMVLAVLLGIAGPLRQATADSSGKADTADPAQEHPAPPQLPENVNGQAGVKAYLLKVAGTCLDASHQLQTVGSEYQKLVAAHDNDPVAAAKAAPQCMAKLIHQMRNAYERIDSYGYEYIEGIVAGVPSLAKYDVELDSGLPKSMAKDGQGPVASVVIHAGELTLDHEGSLNNFLIEPTVFGTNARFVAGEAALPGFDKPVALPKPALVVALADYAVDGYTRMLNDAKTWKPTDQDCFRAITTMTPTLAGYFDEWKQAKEQGGATGGRFVAVARVSDMRGIMGSVRLIWEGEVEKVRQEDPALAANISDGYEQIMKFIDLIEARNDAQALNIQTIDALGSQAKERADKLAVQAAEAAALLGLQVEAQ